MTLRIGFDLDGVLADMESELLQQAESLFGNRLTRHVPEQALPSPFPAPAAERVPGDPQNAIPPGLRFRLSMRQQHRLWRHVEAIDAFWESLQETEPGMVETLARLAADRRWEIIFLTMRPGTAGSTAQVQSQRWLIARGFALPSVYVVQGSRGRIASSLGLDIVVDDRPENCIDVVADSSARPVLVWRDDEKLLPKATEGLGITVVKSVAECLDVLAEVDPTRSENGSVADRLKRFLGWKQPAGA